MSENRLKIGVTQGDTNGVGWEIILKTFVDPRMTELCTPVIYGSPKAAGFYRNTLAEVENIPFETVSSPADAKRGRVNVVPVGESEIKIEPGVPSAAAAKAAADALLRAGEDLKEGLIDALVTAPIHKGSIHGEAFPYPGHTEYFGALLGGEPMMLMCSERLRVALVTGHLPLSEVSAALTQEKIVGRLVALREVLKQDFGIVEPRIAVLSLNPHVGDGGLLGREDEEIIRPAVLEAAEEGVLAYGPFAADGLFASGAYARYDAVLAMYHDQGLIPFKTLAPEGVNCTVCLDRVRTSPDHGVAYDIAGKDQADARSLRAAIFTAIDIVRNRSQWQEWTADPLQHVERERNRDNGREGFDANRQPRAAAPRPEEEEE